MILKYMILFADFPCSNVHKKISQRTKMVEMSPPRSVQIKTSKALGF